MVKETKHRSKTVLVEFSEKFLGREYIILPNLTLKCRDILNLRNEQF